MHLDDYVCIMSIRDALQEDYLSMVARLIIHFRDIRKYHSDSFMIICRIYFQNVCYYSD